MLATEAFAVVGDVVRSRQHADQVALFEMLENHLTWVNQHLEPAIVQPLTMTIGDEFQGVFADLQTALWAVLATQLRSADVVGLRFGIGHGEVQQTPDAEPPRGQSGTAWWGARNSIERVKGLQESKEQYRSCAFESCDPRLGGAVDAFLVLRDRLLHDMDEKDRTIALGLITGQTQARTAADLGIDPAAVSRRKNTHGIASLLSAHTALGAWPQWSD